MAMFDPEPVAPEPAPVVRPRVPPSQRRSIGTSLVLGLAAVVAVGGLAFAAGRLTAPTAVAATGFNGARANGGAGTGEFPRASGGTGGFGGLRGAGGAGFGIQGTVTAVASDHLTLQLANGTTINVPLTSSTTYHQQTTGSASDVQVGKQVQVQLTRNTSDGAAASPGAGGATSGFGAASSVTVVGQ